MTENKLYGVFRYDPEDCESNFTFCGIADDFEKAKKIAKEAKKDELDPGEFYYILTIELNEYQAVNTYELTAHRDEFIKALRQTFYTAELEEK